MNDKELADAIVTLGVGQALDFDGAKTTFYAIGEDSGPFLYPEQFVRDWRVAGAMMEKMLDKQDLRIAMQILDSTTRHVHFVGIADGQSESLPRAINEAAAEALK